MAAALPALLRGKKAAAFASRELLGTLAPSVRPEEHGAGPAVRDAQGARQPFDGITDWDGEPSSSSGRAFFDHERRGMGREALDHFLAARRGSAMLSRALKACGPMTPGMGEQLHCLCVKCGLDRGDVGVGTALVDIHMKRDGEDGRVFEGTPPKRNVVTWTALLTGCCAQADVTALFFRMRADGVRPSPFAFAAVLSAVASQGALDVGRRVHAQSVKFGCGSTVVCNSLMNMYLKCGLVEEAKAVFCRMETRDVVSWNTLMAGLLLNGRELEALQLFHDSRASAAKMSRSTYSTAIKLCASLKQLALARQLHSCVLKHGFSSDGNVMTAVMDAYSKCGELDDAFSIFAVMPGSQSVVSWTAMISGCIQNGNIPLAADLFSRMREGDIKPNEFTYSTMLMASLSILPSQIHAQIIKTNYQHAPSVGTALLSSYSKLGSTGEALSVFKTIDQKDVVAWSAMLSCYSQAGDCDGAANVFIKMSMQGMKPNEFTISSAIDACASPTAGVDQGRQFHAVSIKYRYQNAICVGSALVSMYARKGSIDSARSVFERQTDRDLVSWNSMISGYAQHGYSKEALDTFRQMEAAGIEMDDVTFLAVTIACTHAGLVNEGQQYFDSMVTDHKISPAMEHYACMVDLYSRAGKLDETMKVIGGMPFPAGAMVWRTLLGACRVHKNVELGKLAAEKLLLLEPHDSASYVLLSNIYAATGKWKERDEVRKLMDSKKVKKEAGCSWIQIKNKVHSFIASDRSHPVSDQIYAKLKAMTARLKQVGYCPNTSFVLHDMAEEQKEAMLVMHSERLALAFGLIATPPGIPLQIVKNLRVCGDCHTVMKMVSAVEDREIIMRDCSRFHHFKSGACSCGDFW
ncbi:pentatricopeptide repeat-containing protein At2g27610 [Lolium perenne]|uniref:pentatricopeptide repeat-containing protein At2g27610 n=1 Tax=Lolium perenne TaxID=4522 RepID=UPI0021E9F999|nr:pentatricopeptide repeat-containing protein At2g27610 [Lolium perenne]